MSLDPRALKIYIDGSALRNPGGAGGIAAWLEFPSDFNQDDKLLFQEGFQETTNNRMELLACIRAYEYVREQGATLRVQRVQIITDSKYVHDCSFRAENWKRNRWRNYDNRPIENSDLLEKLISIRRKVKIRTELHWTLGKKSPILKSVDRSAKAGAAQPWDVDRGFRGGKMARTKVIGRSAATLFVANGQEEVIRVYRSRLLNRSDHKIYFDVLSEQDSEFTHKAYAYTSGELSLQLHRTHLYRVRFNGNPKNPRIEAVIEEVAIDPRDDGL
jgi:ribonuclease HI